MPRQATRAQLILGRRKPTKTQEQAIANDLLRAATASRDARRALLVMLAGRRRKVAHDIINLLPAGSLVETACAAYMDKTDIPADIVLFTALTLVSAHALRKGATIDMDGQEILPTPWTIVLAGSGTGKTYAFRSLVKRAGVQLDLLPDASSAAKFIENLALHNNSLYLRDEIGQLVRGIDEQAHMAELKDYLLRCYDHQPIQRNTKQEEIEVIKPAFCLLGFNVDKTWASCVPPESLLDGFCQRFNYVVPRDFDGRVVPLYRLSAWEKELAQAWQEIEQLPIHPVYTVTEDAQAAYEEGFRQLHRELGGKVPMSFFRRSAFSAFKYALAYHLVLRKTTPEIDARDIGWAMRVIDRHLSDTGSVLDSYNVSDLERKVEIVEGLRAEARDEGVVLTARMVLRGCKAVRSAQEARGLMQLVLEGDEAATPEEWDQANGIVRRGRPPRRPGLRVLYTAA